MGQQAFVAAIYQALAGDQSAGSLYADLAGRVYYVRGPRDGPLPYLRFAIIADAARPYFDGSADVDGRLRIDLWGDLDAGAAALGAVNDKLLAALDGAALTVAGYPDAGVLCLDRGVPAAADMEPGSLRLTSHWRFWGMSS